MSAMTLQDIHIQMMIDEGIKSALRQVADGFFEKANALVCGGAATEVGGKFYPVVLGLRAASTVIHEVANQDDG